MLGVLWATSALICRGRGVAIAARKMSTSCQRSNAASSEVRDSSSLVSAPRAGQSGKLTGCNQKRKARTDPRSDTLHMQVSGRRFFCCSSCVGLHPLSCSGTASCTGGPAAAVAWSSVWNGMEIETVGMGPEGRSGRFSRLQPGPSRPVFT